MDLWLNCKEEECSFSQVQLDHSDFYITKKSLPKLLYSVYLLLQVAVSPFSRYRYFCNIMTNLGENLNFIVLYLIPQIFSINQRNKLFNTSL